MSIAYICDGCGAGVREMPAEIGHVIRRHYCKDCEAKARQFVEAEDELRRQLQGRFAADRELLISNLSSNGFRLPDVPETKGGEGA